MKHEIGQKVYLPEIGKTAIVEEVNDKGEVTKVKIGDKIINVVGWIVKNLDTIQIILVFLLNIFKKKKR